MPVIPFADFFGSEKTISIPDIDASSSVMKKNVFHMFTTLPNRHYINRRPNFLDVRVFEWNAVYYYKGALYEYGPRIFGYHDDDLLNYIKLFRTIPELIKIMKVDKNAEALFQIPQSMAIDYTRLTTGFLGHINFRTTTEQTTSKITDYEQKLKGHKPAWFRISKSYLVQICYANAILLRYNLPIMPIFFIVSQEADGSWPNYDKITYGFDVENKIKHKTSNYVTDAEIRMVYKLMYEHPSRHMQNAAQKTCILLKKHYGYNDPSLSPNPNIKSISPINGYIPSPEYRSIATHPAIQYEIQSPDILFAGFENRIRKKGAPAYFARDLKDQPEWVRHQTRMLENLYTNG